MDLVYENDCINLFKLLIYIFKYWLVSLYWGWVIENKSIVELSRNKVSDLISDRDGAINAVGLKTEQQRVVW